MKKILYVPSLNLPVIFWRIESYADALVQYKEDCLVHVDFLLDPSMGNWDSVAKGKGQISDIIRNKLECAFLFFDIIVFQKIQFKPGYSLIAELKEKHPETKIVAEIDDSIGDVTPSNFYFDKFIEQHSISANHCIISDAVIASTNYLANSIKPIVGKDKPVYVAPNCINENVWKYDAHDLPKRRFKRIGYVAGGGHDEDLRILYKAFKLIKDKDIVLDIKYGGFKPEWLDLSDNIKFQHVHWHISEYAQKLYDMDVDVAVAPLRDTQFNRCKSNLKWLEWASMGKTVVASNVEPYRETNGSIYLSSNYYEDFALTIKQALEEQFDARELKRGIKKYHNADKEAKKILTFFNKL